MKGNEDTHVNHEALIPSYREHPTTEDIQADAHWPPITREIQFPNVNEIGHGTSVAEGPISDDSVVGPTITPSRTGRSRIRTLEVTDGQCIVSEWAVRGER